MLKNLIFDLDGTIIDSSKEVLLCLERAFNQVGYPIDKANIKSNIIGPPLLQIIKLVAPELQDKVIIDDILKAFRKLYDYDKDDVSELYEGVLDLLKKSKGLHKRLFIATFKPNIPTIRILKQFDLDMFNDVYTIDKFSTNMTKSEMIKDIIKKYHLSNNETVMIGDASSDVKAGMDADVHTVGVLWGYGDDKTDLIQNSDKVVQDVRELEEYLDLN